MRHAALDVSHASALSLSGLLRIVTDRCSAQEACLARGEAPEAPAPPSLSALDLLRPRETGVTPGSHLFASEASQEGSDREGMPRDGIPVTWVTCPAPGPQRPRAAARRGSVLSDGPMGGTAGCAEQPMSTFAQCSPVECAAGTDL